MSTWRVKAGTCFWKSFQIGPWLQGFSTWWPSKRISFDGFPGNLDTILNLLHKWIYNRHVWMDICPICTFLCWTSWNMSLWKSWKSSGCCASKLAQYPGHLPNFYKEILLEVQNQNANRTYVHPNVSVTTYGVHLCTLLCIKQGAQYRQYTFLW